MCKCEISIFFLIKTIIITQSLWHFGLRYVWFKIFQTTWPITSLRLYRNLCMTHNFINSTKPKSSQNPQCQKSIHHSKTNPPKPIKKKIKTPFTTAPPYRILNVSPTAAISYCFPPEACRIGNSGYHIGEDWCRRGKYLNFSRVDSQLSDFAGKASHWKRANAEVSVCVLWALR